MPIYQNSFVTKNNLILGNCQILSAATVGATFVNLGAGNVKSAVHNITKYDVQAANAPDPIEGIAEETVTIDFEMIEYNGTNLSSIMCGALSSPTTSSSVQTIHAGGNTTITPRAFRITNTTYSQGGLTVQTILTVYTATMDTGPSFQFKSDNDADPIAIMPVTITAKVDTSRTKGQQLYSLTRDVPAS